MNRIANLSGHQARVGLMAIMEGRNLYEALDIAEKGEQNNHFAHQVVKRRRDK